MEQNYEVFERLTELWLSVYSSEVEEHSLLLKCWGFDNADSLYEELERVRDSVRQYNKEERT